MSRASSALENDSVRGEQDAPEEEILFERCVPLSFIHHFICRYVILCLMFWYIYLLCFDLDCRNIINEAMIRRTVVTDMGERHDKSTIPTEEEVVLGRFISLSVSLVAALFLSFSLFLSLSLLSMLFPACLLTVLSPMIYKQRMSQI